MVILRFSIKISIKKYFYSFPKLIIVSVRKIFKGKLLRKDVTCEFFRIYYKGG